MAGSLDLGDDSQLGAHNKSQFRKSGIANWFWVGWPIFWRDLSGSGVVFVTNGWVNGSGLVRWLMLDL